MALAQRLMLGFAFWAVALGAPAAAAEFLAGNRVVIPADAVYDGDVYAAGAQVVVDGQVKGDLIVAGGTVSVNGRVDGDLIGAGGTVEVNGPVGQAARVAGGEVKLASQVGGDLLAAGSRVTTAPSAEVYGETFARAGELALAGILGNHLRAQGSNLALTGTVYGPAEVEAPRLSVGPTAVVEGGLRMKTATPNAVAPGARVSGGIDATLWEARSTWRDLGGWAFRLVTALLVGVVLLWLVPDAARRSGQVATRAPLIRMLLGLGVLIGGPLASIMVMLSVIGLPLGVMMLGLFGAALYLSQIVVAWATGRALVGRWTNLEAHWKQTLALLLGLVIVYLARSIPVAGPYIAFMIVIWGLGTLMTLAYQGYHEHRGARV